MTLELNCEQANLMKTALLEYQRHLREQERLHCAGLSTTGIELCQKRLVLESLLTAVGGTAKYTCRIKSGSTTELLSGMAHG